MPDLEGDLEKYKDLDSLLYINPMQMSEEEIAKLDKLFDVCPNVRISDDLNVTYATPEEFKNGENKIKGIMSKINSNWHIIQRAASIDDSLGKLISYSPDHETEVFDPNNSRNIWKILNSGYGVCNGISYLAKYIYGRVGIESEVIGSNMHAFLLLKDIELPCEDGSTKKGNTISDITWDLSKHRYGARPICFCKSYDEIRKLDISESTGDSKCHELSEIGETINLDEKSLEEVYRSVGLTEIDGKFPIHTLHTDSASIDDSNLSKQEKIRKKLELVSKWCPTFAVCQNATVSILSNLLDANMDMENWCSVDRVYDKKDKEKKPILYVYFDSLDTGKIFYYADKDTQRFEQLSIEEFEDRFECYDMDLGKIGIKPWERGVNVSQKETIIDPHTFGAIPAALLDRKEER